MPKQRKPMSDEHKRKMQEGRARKQAEKAQIAPPVAPPVPAEPTPENQPEPQRELSPLEQQVAMLAAEVERLKALNADKTITPEQGLQETAKLQGVQIGANGIQGIQYKYPVEKSYYPDPTDRLYDLPELRRYAMRENFYFKWDVNGLIYENHNITYSEPQFTVELARKLFDEEGNELDQVAFVNRIYLTEDELYTRMVATRMGMDTSNFEDLMNEVRFYRIKTWILQLFNPPQIRARSGANTVIIDGKPVEMRDKEEFTSASAGADTAAVIQRETAVDYE